MWKLIKGHTQGFYIVVIASSISYGWCVSSAVSTTHLYKKYRSTTRANVTEITITELPKGSVKNILFTIISYQILCSTQKFKNCSKLDLPTVPFIYSSQIAPFFEMITGQGSRFYQRRRALIWVGCIRAYEPRCTNTWSCRRMDLLVRAGFWTVAVVFLALIASFVRFMVCSLAVVCKHYSTIHAVVWEIF